VGATRSVFDGNPRSPKLAERRKRFNVFEVYETDYAMVQDASVALPSSTGFPLALVTCSSSPESVTASIS
jgi:hypothetical protein